MNSIETLAEMFSHFPGIGPRQAKRFVYYLLSRDKGTTQAFVDAVERLKTETLQCTECKRYFTKNGSAKSICNICSDEHRDRTLLMLVPRDADFDAVEKSGGYKGYYFILGGSLPILEKEPQKRIRVSELEKRIGKSKKDLKEIILAMNANAEGENTAIFIKEKFKDTDILFSELGRGLSTGSELEYADPDTLKNALLHRTN
ncbi:MAG: recombination mediator RecR [Patescibacteria group bacterium]